MKNTHATKLATPHTTNHIAAIHVLKARLKLADDDYRALLLHLCGKASSKDMNQTERERVREHMQALAARMGVAQPGPDKGKLARDKARASPRERKVWALWLQLGRDGVVRNTSAAALHAWVERTVHVSALGFANNAQLDTLIEALKAWQLRGGDHASA